MPPASELGHDHLNGGDLFLGVDVHGMPRPLSADRDAVVHVEHNFDARAVARHRFVDGVVHHFVHEVMQTTVIRAAMYMAGRFRTAGDLQE